ncbi:hypothetical protein GOBAR_AA27664 [Gossypium barbadense]|uniref:Uncharacterized protein n=1 Tax=Gossypium barbadense TaxID=3634 RepID=A0A2P5WPI9_GOSBA|nr:hypothetical protein GOBAR_AA27664 [Gossypium barbadense]
MLRGVNTRPGRYSGGAKVAVFLLWILLFFSQLGLHFAVHKQGSRHSFQFVRSPPPRKVWFSGAANSFHAPSSSPHLAGNEGDEKRIVHTCFEMLNDFSELGLGGATTTLELSVPFTHLLCFRVQLLCQPIFAGSHTSLLLSVMGIKRASNNVTMNVIVMNR